MKTFFVELVSPSDVAIPGICRTIVQAENVFQAERDARLNAGSAYREGRQDIREAKSLPAYFVDDNRVCMEFLHTGFNHVSVLKAVS